MPESLRLEDFLDHDLLYALEDAADAEGWATSQEIAALIGIENDRPTQSVGSRLGWAKRYGWAESEAEKGGLKWRLNDIGYELLHPKKLTPAIERALSTLSEGQRAEITEVIARELPRSSRQAAHLARRTWQHHFGGWRDASIAPQRKQ